MKFLKITLLIPLLSALLNGHPIPDIPVIGKFNSDGNCSIYTEIDTRSFAEDPEQVPFLTNSAFKQLSDSNKTDLFAPVKIEAQEDKRIKKDKSKVIFIFILLIYKK